MAGCPVFGSTSEESLYYAIDPDPGDDLPETMVWQNIPMTSESLNATLSSTISEQITPQRSYSGSLLTAGEVGGQFGIELQAGPLLDNLLISVLQADETLTMATAGSWIPTESIKNGSVKKCLTFLKLIKTGDTTYDQYIFRGCQVSALTMEMTTGALITGTATIMGIRPDTPITNAVIPVTWTLTAASPLPLMSAADSLASLEVLDALGVDSGVTFSDFSLTVDNQMRQQQAIGLGHPFAAGVASGRFMATASGTVYYASPLIYENFLNDASLQIKLTLRDSDDEGYLIWMHHVKVTSGSLPEAGGPDQDLTVSTEFQAYEDPTHGTLGIYRTGA